LFVCDWVTSRIREHKNMIEFVEKTWLAWWLFAALVILRWFYVVCPSETIEPELDCEEIAKKSAAA
jgi:hypothetical protein